MEHLNQELKLQFEEIHRNDVSQDLPEETYTLHIGKKNSFCPPF